MRLAVLLPCFLPACGAPAHTAAPPAADDSAPVDTAGDTDTAPVDSDTDTATHPDDTGTAACADVDDDCDGVDDDCDGAIDEDAPDRVLVYADADGDGWGVGEPALACPGTTGTAEQGGDCDDANPLVSPGATEVEANAVDDDCDGTGDALDLVSSTRWGYDSGFADDRCGSGGVGVWGDLTDDGEADLVVACPEAERGAGYVHLVPEVERRGGAGNRSLTPGAGMGTSMAFLGELDGALYFALGAPGENAGAGEIWVYSWAANEGAYLAGASVNDQVGTAAAATDLDGDGAVDLLVGAPGAGGGAGWVVAVAGADVPAISEWDSYDGSANLDLMDVASGWVEGSDGTGAALGAGDLDGDGYGDVVACGDTECAVLGGAGWPLGAGSTADLATTRLLGDVSTAALATGDLDGDAVADLAVGLPTYAGNAGAVAIWTGSGLPSGAANMADAPVFLTGAGATGTSVAVADDQDGDGLGDLLVGAPAEDGAGRLYLATRLASGDLAAAAGASWAGQSPGDCFGERVAFGADMDGDGRAEIAVAAPCRDVPATDIGIVYVMDAFR